MLALFWPRPPVCPPYLHNLSDLTLILQPLQFQVGCANQLVTSEEGSGKPRVSRGLDWARTAEISWLKPAQENLVVAGAAAATEANPSSQPTLAV